MVKRIRKLRDHSAQCRRDRACHGTALLLDHLDVEHQLMPRWGEPDSETDPAE